MEEIGLLFCPNLDGVVQLKQLFCGTQIMSTSGILENENNMQICRR